MTHQPIGFNIAPAHRPWPYGSGDATYLLTEALDRQYDAVTYFLGQRLRELYPARALLEGEDDAFDLERFARAGNCTLQESTTLHNQDITEWQGAAWGTRRRAWQTWFEVEWQGERLDVLITHVSCSDHYFILAESVEAGQRFIAAVCAWDSHLDAELLVFDHGSWRKDSWLYRSIKAAQLDSLILPGSLRQEMLEDITSFFAGRETYEQYNIPWKRGVLFVGPPGNGKTHAVKALVNEVDQRCLYVRGFRSHRGPDEYSISAVFRQARQSAPCILVLEDLDSLITSKNRSFFLNELDGFAGNQGVFTLATTNYPQRLDPAIVDRPSRFDRKYPFALPGTAERAAYVKCWNGSIQPELQLRPEAVVQVAERTDGFSFAYLKELFLSSLMRWISRRGVMADVVLEQVEVLRAQMASMSPPVEDEEDDEDE